MALLSTVISRITASNSSRTLVCRHFSALTPQQPSISHKNYYRNASYDSAGEKFQTVDRSKPYKKIIFGGIVAGTIYALGMKWWSDQQYKASLLQEGHAMSYKDYQITEEIPEFKVARSLRNPADNTKIKFTLYQYQTCPFCCKARAFLDYFGLNYDVIEVNSVTRKQVCGPQCGNYRIFMSPKFYVKSNLKNVEVVKMLFLQI